MNRTGKHKGSYVDASEVVRRQHREVLIDGYNLMHVTRFKPLSQDDGQLKRCREGLLRWLSEHLAARQYRKITIVFDSDRSAGSSYLRWAHIDVHFATEENSADDLIAVMLGQAVNPKHLIVVSSDHRVQVAARRRKATAIDSDQWYDAILDFARSSPEQSEDLQGDESEPLTPAELEEFRRTMSSMPEDIDAHSNGEIMEELENPFPEGYCDDLDV